MKCNETYDDGAGFVTICTQEGPHARHEDESGFSWSNQNDGRRPPIY